MPRECVATFEDQFIKDYAKINSRRPPCHDLAGYGVANEENLYRSDESVVVLMAEDTIKNDSYQFYELPLPEDFLRTKTATRELRVSLCYSPAVRTTRLEYKASKIIFNLIKGSSLDDVQKNFHKKMEKENKKLGDTSTGNREISMELRNKGTAQCSHWNFKQLSPKYKWFVVVTRQDAFGWGDTLNLEDESYSLVVTVTDRESEEAQLYAQISQQIEIKQRVRART